MKDAYYFSHDSNAHKDPKILRLRSIHGWEGYGIFWAIIETLREQEEYKWKASDKHLLSYCFANGEEKINQVIDTCLEIGLIVAEDGFIFSESLTKRMKLREEIAEKRRAAGKKGGSSKSQANAKQDESKESKGKESKGKEIKEEEEEDANPFDFYEQNGFGTLSPLVSEKIDDWMKEYHGSIVVEAMKEAVINNVRKWSYVNKILMNWSESNLKTLQDIKAHMDANKKPAKKPQESKKSEDGIDWDKLNRLRYGNFTPAEESEGPDPFFEELDRKMGKLVT